MKKQTLIALLFIALFSLSASLESKAQQFNVGDKDVNIMIGFGRTYGYGFGFGSSSLTGLPPISLSADYGWRDDIGPGVISLGGYLGASTANYSDNSIYYDYSFKSSDIFIAARSTYHYQLTDAIDTYGGILVGVRISSYKWTGTYLNYSDGSDTDLIARAFVGAKYYFTENLAAMAELGYSIAWLNLGICLKM